MMIRGILVGPGFRIGNSASRQLRGSLRPPRPPAHDVPRGSTRSSTLHSTSSPGARCAEGINEELDVALNLVPRPTMRRVPMHALGHPRVEPLVLAALDGAPEGALAPPRSPVRIGHLGPGPDRRASAPTVAPRPRPSRPGPARSPRPPVRLFLRGPPHLPDAVDLFTPRPADHLRHSCPGHGAPARCPSDRTTRVLPASRSASSCAGRRTCRTPWISSHLVRRITFGTRVRVMGRLLDAHQTGQPVCYRPPVRVLVRGPPHLPGAAGLFAPHPANHLRCSYPDHGAPARCPSDRTTRVPPHRTDCSLPTKPSMGIDTPSELGILRAGTGCIDLRPAPQCAPQLGSCSANPGTERGLAPERKPPWTHRLDSPRCPPPSRRGRWPSPTPRPHGLARSPGALAHRCSLTVGLPLGSERAPRGRPSSSGADTHQPGRRRRPHGLARSPGALAHRCSLTVGSPLGSERASRSRPSSSGADTPRPGRRRRPHGFARSPGALAHRCSLTVGSPLGSERASRGRPSSSGADTPWPTRRRHVPAGAPSTGELT